ncbi:MAG: hypothetical protein CL561_05630 [Alphaproteobacteria bacterium]|nr:hypothetical protein [Alphaproteobacteria bacterium]|tara:strand:+ start:288591 stop:288917 length:327 start_codon:yes stop_codon:yes gene_type:complete
MLHDQFRIVTQKLNTFFEKSLDDFKKTESYSTCMGVTMAFSGLGNSFMAVAKDNGITPTEKLNRDIYGLAATVKDLSELLEGQQGMDDVDFRKEIQLTVNKLAANGIA